jgi:predicted O-methyltransferase YrrM
MCQGADAELLYALLRRLRPARVLETGSGFSTMVSAQACARNAKEGDPAELTAVDPQPRTEIGEAIDGLSRVERRDVRELPFERFTELGAGDVLFIDTSHVVKLGSEVNLLFLEVLPRLAPGVWVHVHDIFLPYEYPRQLLAASGGFNEQYLLQAFLTGNHGWEVRLAVHAIWREQRERLTAVIPALFASPNPHFVPSSFWLRRSD